MDVPESDPATDRSCASMREGGDAVTPLPGHRGEAWQDHGSPPPRVLAARCICRVKQGMNREAWIANHVPLFLQQWVRDYVTDPRNWARDT